jgi:beta-lactamase class D
MKSLYIIFPLVIFVSCSQPGKQEKSQVNETVSSAIYRQDLQQILDSVQVKGSVLVYDPQSKRSWSNDFSRCNLGFLPASTFKIVNSIIALETGVVENDSTLFSWNGEKRRLPVWEQDLIFRDAFQVSCVPCYQEIARKIGVRRMKEFLDKLDYGNMVVDSGNIDIFWLEGDSRISMNQQLVFLERLYNAELPVSERTIRIIKRMMILEKNTGYTFSGKTGWAVRNGNNTGWFVGYLEKNNQVYYIVTNIEPLEEFNMDLFPKIRTGISQEAFRRLKIIE